MLSDDRRVVCLVKGDERYVFIYDNESRTECLRTFGRFAANPELSFSWWDAVVLSQRMKQEAGQC